MTARESTTTESIPESTRGPGDRRAAASRNEVGRSVAAYAVFANGGYRVAPYFIERVEDARGNVLMAAKPAAAGAEAERVIDERNAFIMTSIMREYHAHGHRRAGDEARSRRSCRKDRHHQ